MNYERFEAMTARYPRLRIGVVGDLCLDRYLEIDPARAEFARGLGFDAVAWAREGLLDAVERGYNSVELTVEHGGPQTVFWMEILIDPAPTNR